MLVFELGNVLLSNRLSHFLLANLNCEEDELTGYSVSRFDFEFEFTVFKPHNTKS